MATTIKRAVLIGINYTNNTTKKLNGAINDVIKMRDYLLNSGHFQRNEMFIMTDNTQGEAYPTRQNILARLTRLVNVANNNPQAQIFYHIYFSGHGKNIKNGNITHQAIAPIDFVTNGFITDVTLTENFAKLLPSNVQVFFMVDACNSETIIDLRFSYPLNGNDTYVVRENIPVTNSKFILLSACRDNQLAQEIGFDVAGNIVKRHYNKVVYDVIHSGRIYYYDTNRISTCPFSAAQNISERACRNSAVLLDTGNGCPNNNNNAVLPDTNDPCDNVPLPPVSFNGVLTTAFLSVYNDNLTYYQVVNQIRNWTKTRGFTQVAQLNSGVLIDPYTETKMIK